MSVVTFDTLKYADTLKAAGVPAAQAEGQARAMAELLQVQFKELATKPDLLSLRDELKRDIAEQGREFAAKLDLKIAEVRTDITVLRWMVGACVPLLVGIAIRLFFFKP